MLIAFVMPHAPLAPLIFLWPSIIEVTANFPLFCLNDNVVTMLSFLEFFLGVGCKAGLAFSWLESWPRLWTEKLVENLAF